MLPNGIGFGICSPCSSSIGICLAVVVCASFVIGLFARSAGALLGFLLGSGTECGSAAMLDCDDTRLGLAAEARCVDDTGCVTKLAVGWMLSTLKASTSATLADWPEVWRGTDLAIAGSTAEISRSWNFANDGFSFWGSVAVTKSDRRATSIDPMNAAAISNPIKILGRRMRRTPWTSSRPKPNLLLAGSSSTLQRHKRTSGRATNDHCRNTSDRYAIGHTAVLTPPRRHSILAAALGLVPCFTPVHSPESNGIAEAFVKTFKRDYDVQAVLIPDRNAGNLELSLSLREQSSDEPVRTIPPSAQFSLANTFLNDLTGSSDTFVEKCGGVIFTFHHTQAGVRKAVIWYLSSSRLRMELRKAGALASLD
jgi:hypothetical protein